MNDRFKFRVWSVEEKTYDHKFPFNSIGLFYVAENGRLFSDFGNSVAPEMHQDQFIVEQCTGLKDKNDNLIYEGDIVKCDRDFDDGRVGLIKKVAFFDGAFCLGNLDGFDWYYLNKFHNIEIIGNIHEQKDAA